MTIRAGELLDEDEELKYDYHIKWCKLYKDYCIQLYNSEKTLDTIEKLTEMETNIWACIYRSLNRRRDIKYIDKGLAQKNKEDMVINQSDEFDQEWELNPNPKEDFSYPIIPEPIATRGVSQHDPMENLKRIESKHFWLRVLDIPRQPRGSIIGVPQNYQDIKPEENKYLDEELLVLYYITDLIT